MVQKIGCLLYKKYLEIEELIEDEYPGLSYKTDIEIEIDKKNENIKKKEKIKKKWRYKRF